MNTNEITKRYYSYWLGVDPRQMDGEGVSFVHSQERDKVQKGYTKQYDIYTWHTDKLIIVSYGSGINNSLDEWKGQVKIGMNPEDLMSLFKSVYGVQPKRNIKFVFNESPTGIPQAYKLTYNDYPLYHEFFTACNPNCGNTDWLKEYFDDMVNADLCFGVIIDGKLASMNDLPDMPYMEDQVREIGINTLKEYRGRGLAKAVCSSCAREMLAKNICPQWATSYGNVSSERLAYSVGFLKLSDIISVTL